MVAISIFALVVTGITALMGSTLNLTRNNRNRAVAANLASQEMDVVRSTAFTSLPIGQVTSTQSVDGVPYEVIRETEWVTQNATTGPCQAPSGAPPAYLRVTVSVQWAAMNGVEPPSSQTVVTPPIGTYDEHTGHIATSVIDPDGQPLGGVLVSSTGPGGTDYLTTTSDGCAFFAYQDAGSYTVEVTAVGHVDGLNDSSPSQTTTVIVGATSSVQFQFGDSTDLVVTYHGWNGANVPNAIPLTITNSHILPGGTHGYTGAGTPRTIRSVPWSDGYSVFGGTCADADPIGLNSGGVPFYPGAVRTNPIDAVAGGTSNFHLDLPEVARLRRARRDPGRGRQHRRRPRTGQRMPGRSVVRSWQHGRERRGLHGDPVRDLDDLRERHHAADRHTHPRGPADPARRLRGDAMITPAALRRLRDEAGVSVTEVLVTVAIVSVVIGFVLQGFASLQNATTGASLRSTTSAKHGC